MLKKIKVTGMGYILSAAVLLVCVCLFAACESREAASAPTASPEYSEPIIGGSGGEQSFEEIELFFEEAQAPLSSSSARDNTPVVLKPKADAEVVFTDSESEIDVSNTDQGYVMVKYTGDADKVKMQLTCSGCDTYTYNLFPENGYEVFPLSSGDGTYTMNIFRNVGGDKYVAVASHSFDVVLCDERIPFLYPNQYIDYDENTEAVELGREAASGAETELDVVNAVFNYVVDNYEYDYDMAQSVSTRYLPVLDDVVAKKKGICFDFAALMSAMLRTQRIPTQLVVGYMDTQYHAWVSVYIKDIGWVRNIIHFDGVSWTLMDPTDIMTNPQSDADTSKYNALFKY